MKPPRPTTTATRCEHAATLNTPHNRTPHTHNRTLTRSHNRTLTRSHRTTACAQAFGETKSDKDFIDDSLSVNDALDLYDDESSGKCNNIIYAESGEGFRCNSPCNPAEQLCKYCRRFCV